MNQNKSNSIFINAENKQRDFEMERRVRQFNDGKSNNEFNCGCALNCADRDTHRAVHGVNSRN